MCAEPAESPPPAGESDALLKSIQMAPLSDADIKRLVEMLVGKLSSADAAMTIPNIDWTKVCDSFSLLLQYYYYSFNVRFFRAYAGQTFFS